MFSWWQNENNEGRRKGKRNDNKRVIKWMDLTGETDLLKRNFKINGNCSDFYYYTEVFQTFQFALSPPSLSSSLLIQIMNKNCTNLSSFWTHQQFVSRMYLKFTIWDVKPGSAHLSFIIFCNCMKDKINVRKFCITN